MIISYDEFYNLFKKHILAGEDFYLALLKKSSIFQVVIVDFFAYRMLAVNYYKMLPKAVKLSLGIF